MTGTPHVQWNGHGHPDTHTITCSSHKKINDWVMYKIPRLHLVGLCMPHDTEFTCCMCTRSCRVRVKAKCQPVMIVTVHTSDVEMQLHRYRGRMQVNSHPVMIFYQLQIRFSNICQFALQVLPVLYIIENLMCILTSDKCFTMVILSFKYNHNDVTVI